MLTWQHIGKIHEYTTSEWASGTTACTQKNPATRRPVPGQSALSRDVKLLESGQQLILTVDGIGFRVNHPEELLEVDGSALVLVNRHDALLELFFRQILTEGAQAGPQL